MAKKRQSVSTLRKAFIADIIANPDDDAPRLVYADWLSENGDPARAEFIRVQIELAKLEDQGEERGEALRAREKELLDENWDRWIREVPPFLRSVHGLEEQSERITYHRGFVEDVVVPLSSLARYKKAWQQAMDNNPIRFLDINYSLQEDIDALREMPWFERINGLEVGFSRDADWGAFFRADLSRIKKLYLNTHTAGFDYFFSFLSENESFHPEILSIQPRLREQEINILRQAPWFDTLRDLYINRCNVNLLDELAERLPQGAQLRVHCGQPFEHIDGPPSPLVNVTMLNAREALITGTCQP